MNFKEKFPTDESFRQYIDTMWSTTTEDILSTMGPLEKRYKRAQILGGIVGVYFAAGFVVVTLSDKGFIDIDAWLPSGIFTDPSFLSILGVVMFGLIFCIVLPALVLLYAVTLRKIFTARLNAQLFPRIFSYLGVEATHFSTSRVLAGGTLPSFWQVIRTNKNSQIQEDAQEYKKILTVLDASELITEPRNGVVVDDLIVMQIEGSELLVSELDVTNVTGTGKHRRVKRLFHGYFITFDIPLALQHKTFVSTEGDKKGFGHATFWKQLQNKGIQETKLEWNDFEELLYVATTDPTEARYVLTTNFMADLYDWWSEQKGNIRISFIGDKMYLLFPDEKIKMGGSVGAINTKNLQRYVLSNALPLLRILKLVEGVPAKPSGEHGGTQLHQRNI